MIKSIAIILSDNDFWSTFNPLLSNVRNTILDPWDKEGLSKENVKKIIIEGLRWHYIAYQYQYRPSYAYGITNYDAEKDITSTVEYLKSNIEIRFDEDADRAPFELDHDGGSWYIHIETGQIASF